VIPSVTNPPAIVETKPSIDCLNAKTGLHLGFAKGPGVSYKSSSGESFCACGGERRLFYET
jgi:hypothetical protein